MVVIFIFLEIILINGDFVCFRKFLKKRALCKGVVRKRTHRFNTPEKCCKKKGQGYYSLKVSTGKKNKYVCTPCGSLLPPTTPPTTTESPEWGTWGACSVSCGAGWRSRYKLCENCDMNHFNNVQSEPCLDNFYCPVDGNWGPWFGWSPCSKSCDGGTRRRERRCNYPPPTHGGKDCPGRAERVQTCNEDECPVDGNWGSWTRFSICSVTCGFGTMTKRRQCNNPKPASGGKTCPGSAVGNRRCNHRQCPQHGGWSLWSSWSSCPVTCGEGARVRKRTCDSPKPLFGGEKCTGSDTDEQLCKLPNLCPIHGGWSSWTNFGRCSGPPCGKGTQRRSRSCTNPRAKHGGHPCRGFTSDSRICINDKNCPGANDPRWCEWNDWSPCTATCTGLNSMQVRQRACLCPAPKMGQRSCQGESFQVRECVNVPPCRPVIVSQQNRNVGSANKDEEVNLNSTVTSIPEVISDEDLAKANGKT